MKTTHNGPYYGAGARVRYRGDDGTWRLATVASHLGRADELVEVEPETDGERTFATLLVSPDRVIYGWR